MEKIKKERVELHCHSEDSYGDGIATIGQILKYLKVNNMEAVALTEHELSGLPFDSESLKKKGFFQKIIYGVEVYTVDDVSPVITNYSGQDYEEEFIVVDLETTGFSPKKSEIIELSALKIQGDKILERFHCYVKPNEDISLRIAELTGINNDVVKDAPKIKDVLKEFFDFVGTGMIVMHDADFDIRFIKSAARKNEYKFEYTILDTMRLARYLLPLTKGRLDSVCDTLNIECPIGDATEAIARCFIEMISMLKEQNLHFSELNEAIQGNEEYIKHSPRYHLTILPKDENGRKNMWNIESDSQNKYFNIRARVPLSQLLSNREGLLIGSACSAGALYNAILDGVDEESLLELAGMYDYLEVQPTSNDIYLFEDTRCDVKSEGDLQEIIKKIIHLGNVLGKPVVATSDAHYLRPEDKEERNAMLKEYGVKEQYEDLHFRTTQEMLEEFSFLPEDVAYEIVVTNTNKIAEMCQEI